MNNTEEKTIETATKQTPGAIVDLDGTLLDSEKFWDLLPFDYIRSKGLEPPPDIREKVKEMELDECSRYMKTRLGLKEEPSVIKSELVEMIRSVYTEKAQFYPGAADFVKGLHNRGVRMALFSATEHSCIVACLKRHGVLECFDFIVSTMDIGMDKHVPEAFLKVQEMLGTTLENTIVYEDAPYALKGAHSAGFKTITLEH